jgi:hypothetical protein
MKKEMKRVSFFAEYEEWIDFLTSCKRRRTTASEQIRIFIAAFNRK